MFKNKKYDMYGHLLSPLEFCNEDNLETNGSRKINSNSILTLDEERRPTLTPSDEETEEDPSDLAQDGAIEPEVDLRVYKRRYWILVIFTYTNILTTAIWGSFGPIMSSVKLAFGWSSGHVAFIEMCGALFSMLWLLPLNWITQKYGLRTGMLIVNILLISSAGLRCLPVNDAVYIYVVNVSSMLTGMGEALLMSLPTMLSSTWFPASERATATAVASLAPHLAVVGIYLAPVVVPDPTGDALTKGEIKGDIVHLMHIHLALAGVCLLCTLAYFPDKPPRPPSLSSAVQRSGYTQNFKIFIRNPQVMIVGVAYIFTISIPLSWIFVMNFSLGCLEISQNQTMWIAIASAVMSAAASFVVARISDHFQRRLKTFSIILLVSASFFFFWFLLMTENVIKHSFGQVFISIVCAASLQFSAVPLMLELAVELAYPCPEGMVGCLFTLLMTFIDTCFFALLMIPSQCFRWISFVLFGISFLGIIPLLLVKDAYNRSNIEQSSSDSKEAYSQGEW